jgi:hypothetical protein
MTRMGHDSARAALIYQHEGTRALTRASRMRSTLMSRPSATRATMAWPWRTSPQANCTLIAREVSNDPEPSRPRFGTVVLTWAFCLERVTGIEPALSAWESVPSGPVMRADLRVGLSASDVRDRSSPRLMAR